MKQTLIQKREKLKKELKQIRKDISEKKRRAKLRRVKSFQVLLGKINIYKLISKDPENLFYFIGVLSNHLDFKDREAYIKKGKEVVLSTKQKKYCKVNQKRNSKNG